MTLHTKTLITCIITAMICLGCSTKKNTAATRAYHQMCTDYNVGFNAKNAYRDGMKALNGAGKDDFTRLLPLFPVENHEGCQAAGPNMQTTIDKCRKAIKKHSITKRPKRNQARWSNPKYQYFYRQEEYVRGVKEAWVLLAKAEMHKGDFAEAAATFSYIQRHYPSDLDIVCEARIWQARAYGEMGWLYEAQEVFDKIDENHVGRRLALDYTETRAYLLLKTGDLDGALPYLEMALKKEDGGLMKSRIAFIIGQIHMLRNDKRKAAPYLKAAVKNAQDYPMEFNARLLMHQAGASRDGKSLRALNRMLRNSNNKEYKDQIYTTIGNIHIASGDTLRAIEAYRQGAEASTRNGVEKAALLITLGDLHYGMKNYVGAHPCYDEAGNIITAGHEDFERVSLRREVLGELVACHNTVVLQDSLQHLATLSEEERLAVANKIVEDLVAEEARQAQAAKDAEEKGFAEVSRGPGMPPLIGQAGASREWYFYNAQLKRQGQTLFQQKWGRRPLEDNWRRASKISQNFASGVEPDELGEDTEIEDGGAAPDTAGSSPGDGGALDIHKPEYYLRQIPGTDEEIAASKALVADALYEMAGVLDTRLADYPSAIDAYEQFRSRFPSDPREIEVLYACYRICGKAGDTARAELYMRQIVEKYPGSEYAAMLSRPNYADHMRRLLAEQDSIYEATYAAYSRGDFATVSSNYSLMAAENPLSRLMPKFQFLHALTIGKAGQREMFYSELGDLVARYPSSDVAPMCRDILALQNQGRQAQQGSTHGSIIEKREEAVQTAIAETAGQAGSFTRDPQSRHFVMLIPRDTSATALHSLLYDVAAFNFTKFMIKDFDIGLKRAGAERAVTVFSIESLQEALWYENMLLSEPTLQGKVTLDKVRRVIISEDDYEAIEEGGRTWQEYFDTNQK